MPVNMTEPHDNMGVLLHWSEIMQKIIIICGIDIVHPFSCVNLLENVNIVFSYLDLFICFAFDEHLHPAEMLLWVHVESLFPRFQTFHLNSLGKL